MALVQELGVDLVRNDDQVVLLGERRDLADHVGRRDRAGGVVRRHQDEHLRPRRQPLLDLGRHESEALVLVGGYRHRHPVAQLHGGVVGGEAGRRDQHLVARLDEREHAEHDRLLHPRGDHHLVGRVVEAVLARQRGCDRLPQARHPGRVRVVVLVRVEGALSGLDDVRGGVQVGVAAPHGDDVVERGGRLEHLGANRDVLVVDAPGEGAQESVGRGGHRRHLTWVRSRARRTVRASGSWKGGRRRAP